METYAALAACIGRESELIAKAVGKDVSLIRKWKEDPVDGSGTRNPLDTIITVMDTSLRNGRPVADVMAIIRCLEERLAPYIISSSVQDAHSDVMTESARLLAEHAAAIRDGLISPDERRRLQRASQHVRAALDDYDRAVEVSVEAV